MKLKMFFAAASVMAVLYVPAHASLVAYWDFNENSGTVLNDKTGNGNNGTIHGASWAPGISGSSLYFNGIDNYIEITNPMPFRLPQFAIACWIKPQDPYVSQQRVFFSNVQAVSGISDGVILRFSTDLNFCVARADNNGYWLNLDRTVSFDTTSYHFVACSYDGAYMNLYFDGVLVGQQAYSGGIRYSGVSPDIGASLFDTGYLGYFKGNIDEMRIYDQALSTSDLLALYTNKGRIITANLLVPVPTPSYHRRPALLWHAVPGASAYTIQIDTTGKFYQPIVTIAVPDTFFNLVTDLPIDTIFWKVTSKVSDTLSYTSTIGSFVIQDPKVPLLVPYAPKVTLNRKPVLYWHPVAGATSYTVEIGGDSLFANPQIIVPVTDTQFAQTVNLNYGLVYWRAKSNLSPAWSCLDMFQVVSDSVPFLNRFNGAIVSTNTPTLTWHPVAGSLSYTIELAQTSSFTGGYIVPLTDTAFTPSVGLSNGTWLWRVSSSRNSLIFSAPDSFVVVPVHSIVGWNSAESRFSVYSRAGNIEISGGALKTANLELALFSPAGKKLFSKTCFSLGSSISVNAAELPPGVYLMEVKAGRTCLRQKFLLGR